MSKTVLTPMALVTSTFAIVHELNMILLSIFSQIFCNLYLYNKDQSNSVFYVECKFMEFTKELKTNVSRDDCIVESLVLSQQFTL